MTIDNSFLIKRFEKFSQIYLLMSKATSLPFVECDPDTFADQVYAFTKEEDLQVYAQRFVKKGYVLEGATIMHERFPILFRQLDMIGVDTVCLIDEGAPVPIALEALCPDPDLLPSPDPSIPQKNETLMLTSIYFLQELRKPMQGENGEPDDERKAALLELEEEMARNLINAEYIIAFDTTEVGGIWNPGEKDSKVKIPFVKNKKGDIFQPVFSDFTEFSRVDMGGQKKMSMMAIAFEDLPGFLGEHATAFVINPGTINLILTKEQIAEMVARYKED